MQVEEQVRRDERMGRATVRLLATAFRLALPVLLFSVALRLRLHRLDAQSLWLDEGRTWAEVTTKSWGSLLIELASPKAAYPLYHLLLKAWVTLAGESEWALRLPSALAGALAVAAIYILGRRLGGRAVGAGASLLMLVSPFALWQSQDAKAYSLHILVVTVGLILLWDAFLGAPGCWRLALAVALLAFLVHRLSLLVVIGAVIAMQLPGLRPGEIQGSPLRSARIRQALRALAVLLPLLTGVGFWWGLQRAEGAASPGEPVGPLEVLGPAIEGLALYRSSPQPWMLLPFAALLLWGFALLIRDIQGGPQRSAASFIAGLGFAPLALYLLLLLVAPHTFDARYLSALYPLFLLIVAWPLRAAQPQPTAWRPAPRVVIGAALLVLAVAASGRALLHKPAGLFSGEPVKEEYREAVRYLAQKIHPDDVIIVNPHYISPLYRYYAARVTPDPLPEPAILPKLGAKGYDWGEFDEDLNAILHGHNRAWLLEAPLHAVQVDPPPTPADQPELMGKLTINFRFAADNRKWSCGPQPWREFLGVRVLCQSFPETYGTREVPEPEVPLYARFGEAIELRGYTFNFFPGTGRRAQAGGILPVTLYWRSTRPLRPEENYVVFLHLVRQPGERPVAQEDIPPQEGALPTNTWIGTPVHDEHAVPLPADLEPGRYTLLLGLYDPAIPGEEGRLPVTESEAPAGKGYIELGTLEVVRP